MTSQPVSKQECIISNHCLPYSPARSAAEHTLFFSFFFLLVLHTESLSSNGSSFTLAWTTEFKLLRYTPTKLQPQSSSCPAYADAWIEWMSSSCSCWVNCRVQAVRTTLLLESLSSNCTGYTPADLMTELKLLNLHSCSSHGLQAARHTLLLS